VLKWAGLGVCVLIVVLWGVSVRWRVAYRGRTHLFVVGWGGVCVVYVPTPDTIAYVRMHGVSSDEGWSISRAPDEPDPGPIRPLPARFDFGFYLPNVQLAGPYRAGSYRTGSTLWPWWIPLILVAIPTAILWYRDRRPPKGCCQGCGYNLRGNVSGVCPECGRVV
jgi:hypothetical protein